MISKYFTCMFVYVNPQISMMPRNIAASWILAVCCLGLLKLFESQVPLEEVEALQQIATEMGATYWRFNGDICELGMVGVSPTPPSGSEGYVDCNCNYNNNTVCHVTKIVVKSYNLPGILPANITKLPYLQEMNLEANNFSGLIPSDIGKLINLKSLRINDNNLSGRIPDFIQNWKQLVRLRISDLNGPPQEFPVLRSITGLATLDVSFNKLVGEIPNDIARNLKTVFVTSNMLSGNIPHTILKDGSNICSLHVNCGGADLTVKENNRRVIYEGDAGGDPTRYLSDNYWGFVSTGDFMDESIYQNSRPIRSTTTTNLSELYTTARLSPLSLTYFHYCLENGSYNVSLHFAEILFTNDQTYFALGRRMFDIYIQENLVRKDFNIEDEARGTGKPVVKYFNATVKNSTLEIRFYWASKGTTRIPNRGDYGSLISAISVNPNLKGLELQTVAFSLKQIKAATNNFDATNKIGEGGFGPVYKGQLPDGTVIAVKQLSSKSRQGNREFLNEIGMISCLQHPNLVKLYGCCIEGDQLLVVYEYMENNSLAQVLFVNDNSWSFSESNKSQLILDWPTRFKICIGIARGLAFLHEESRLKIVHRDIKATNVLLDKDLNPKISDFGLARLNEDEKTHISTKVAGTIGYMAPEYALWGYLTDKVDVYSFGVVVLEIVSGKSNNNYMPSRSFICLLDWRLGSRVDKEEVERTVRVALRCTNATPSLRPSMSEVVQMIEGKMDIPDGVPEGGSTYTSDLRFKAMKDFHHEKQKESSSGSPTVEPGFSSYTSDFYEITRNSLSH
ncbi:hypothetical protein DH2020_032681 [Rehmannia glutinosa]|uniref:non-specific serine/threonine protein kinase n=1 Tax=Rehmannia glutinosa TaxID=99300 RepID=A0ABR0VF66_REHGL